MTADEARPICQTCGIGRLRIERMQFLAPSGERVDRVVTAGPCDHCGGG